MKLTFWKRKKSTDSVVEDSLMASIKSLQYDDVGLIYPYQQNAKNDADFYWESLEEEDIAYLLDDQYVLPWEELFQLQQDPEHSNVLNLLNLPNPTNLHPVIRSEGGLSDPDFKIILDGWCDQNRIKSKGLIKRIGAVLNVDGQEYLLNETTWKLVEKVKEFARISNKVGLTHYYL